ncbi:6-phospho-3-hexuloisomerase [Saccharibacillus sp. CPCC 101409]|uniref:6-phospho-3-hexuloisomerase n=1 Tax=Saccharibacillus sp. CPCC 101409 TaxID=3058041 RepID=UPI0026730CBF|nr:6-phospho-3-hexuloisomerase [Saccharibacillus sp. CPCC 101409]MDO3409330.1 6-phospho-3-hexuloisomerase [Saccharibacillus sp. CPCC 101409]
MSGLSSAPSGAADFAAVIAAELGEAVRGIDAAQAEAFADALDGAANVFTAGAGRSGLMAKALAMRLMHSGSAAYVVGETTTPGIGPGDLLVIGSGSGETRTLVPMAEQARSLGADVAVVTLKADSTLAKLASLTVILPGAPKSREQGDYATIQPMGSLFEQVLLLFGDACVLRLMQRRGLDTNRMYGRHANLE